MFRLKRLENHIVDGERRYLLTIKAERRPNNFLFIFDKNSEMIYYNDRKYLTKKDNLVERARKEAFVCDLTEFAMNVIYFVEELEKEIPKREDKATQEALSNGYF